MFSVLEGVDGVDNEGVGHFVKEKFLIYDGINAFLHNDSKMKTQLLGLGYLFHREYLL
jgi:hypothetical protein